MSKYELIQEKCMYVAGVATVVVKIDGEERSGQGKFGTRVEAMRQALVQATGLSQIKVVGSQTHKKIWAKVSINGGPVFTGRGGTIEEAYVDSLIQDAASDLVVARHSP